MDGGGIGACTLFVGWLAYNTVPILILITVVIILWVELSKTKASSSK